MKSKPSVFIVILFVIVVIVGAIIYFATRQPSPEVFTPAPSGMPTLAATDSHTPTPTSSAEPITGATTTSTPTPTNTPIPTATPTPKPTLLPPVALEEPEDGACLGCESRVTLCWSCPSVLEAEEYYRLRAKGQDPSSFHHTVYHEEDHFTLPPLLPGEYSWAVAIVHSTGADEYVPVSEESEWRSFEILPPPPVVHSISPTAIISGTSAPVVISGENFTRSLTVMIGVPLQAGFVNSSTITATIPVTLRVGEYPVIVENSAGEGESFASFWVQMPTPTPVILPTSTPPTYPPPELIGLDIIGCNVTFRWNWTRELAENEWFAVRVGKGDEIPCSKAWVKEREYTYSIGEEAGDYSWQIAICPGDPSDQSCPKPLAISEREFFRFPGYDKLP